MRNVTVQFLKNPDHLHWGFEAVWLGEDDWGDWISVPVGTKRWKGDAEVRPTREPAVFCVPRNEWWHLHYNGANTRTDYSHFVDIVTPPRWVSENRYEMVDLDLDVAIRVDGTIEIQDEDEFEEHQVIYGYDQAMIDGAVRTTHEIVAALESRQEPFFDVAETWLAKVG